MTPRTSIVTSLDGRIDADSDWQYPFFDGELFEVLVAQWTSADALLVGRRSFEGARLFESVSRRVPFTTREARMLASGGVVLELEATSPAA